MGMRLVLHEQHINPVLYITFGPPKMELLPTPMMSCIAVLGISLWFIPCIAKTKLLF